MKINESKTEKRQNKILQNVKVYCLVEFCAKAMKIKEITIISNNNVMKKLMQTQIEKNELMNSISDDVFGTVNFTSFIISFPE